MSIENILLFGSLLTLLIVATLSFLYSKRFALINGALFIAYVAYMLYGLFYKSQGGTALVWWFYLLVFMGFQLLIMFAYVLINWMRKSNKRKTNSPIISIVLIGSIAIFWGLISLISHYPYALAFTIIGILLIGFAIARLIYDRKSRIRGYSDSTKKIPPPSNNGPS